MDIGKPRSAKCICHIVANRADTKAEKGWIRRRTNELATRRATPDWDLGALNISEKNWIRRDIYDKK